MANVLSGSELGCEKGGGISNRGTGVILFAQVRDKSKRIESLVYYVMLYRLLRSFI